MFHWQRQHNKVFLLGIKVLWSYLSLQLVCKVNSSRIIKYSLPCSFLLSGVFHRAVASGGCDPPTQDCDQRHPEHWALQCVHRGRSAVCHQQDPGGRLPYRPHPCSSHIRSDCDVVILIINRLIISLIYFGRDICLCASYIFYLLVSAKTGYSKWGSAYALFLFSWLLSKDSKSTILEQHAHIIFLCCPCLQASWCTALIK